MVFEFVCNIYEHLRTYNVIVELKDISFSLGLQFQVNVV